MHSYNGQTYTTNGFGAGLDFVFHMFFLIKYSKSLEEGSFRGRSADFLWMLLIGEAADVHHASQQQQMCLSK